MIKGLGRFFTVKSRVVIVFGLPGVGKTHLINQFIGKHSGFCCLSAGTLINAQLSEADRDSLRALSRDGVLMNQERLILAFNQKRQELRGQNIIFDGHCIVKNEECLTDIPVSVIERLVPDLILVIDENPEVIIQRRLNDVSRPYREKETAEEIELLRIRQIKLCNIYSTKLKVPLFVLFSPDLKVFSDVIEQKQ